MDFHVEISEGGKQKAKTLSLKICEMLKSGKK